MDQTYASRPALIAWSFYDFANSAFTTIILTFVFAIYFSGTLVCSAEWAGCLSDEEKASLSVAEQLVNTKGQAAWGYAMSFIGLLIGIVAPIFGAIADHAGRRKPWILAFSTLCIALTACLFFMRPEPYFIIPAVLLVAVANLGFELGIVFNSSMLPQLAKPQSIGRWSGFAWGLGYFGGLISLVIVLILVLGADSGAAKLEATLRSNLIVAGWFLIFMLPMFFFTPDRAGTGLSLSQAVSKGLGGLFGTLRQVWRDKNMRQFLIARLLFTDGVNTLFTMGATYAAIRHGMKLEQIITFGIALNVTSGIGAMAFGWLDDKLGSKFLIQLSLVGLMILALPALFTSSFAPDGQEVLVFIILTTLAGFFVGPVQSASRSAMARMAPMTQMTEYFGLLAFTGRITAFLGPLMVAIITTQTGNMDIGMLPIVGFWLVGFILMFGVKIERMQT